MTRPRCGVCMAGGHTFLLLGVGLGLLGGIGHLLVFAMLAPLCCWVIAVLFYFSARTHS